MEEKTDITENLKNMVYKLTMEKNLSEEEKEIIERIVEEKNYP